MTILDYAKLDLILFMIFIIMSIIVTLVLLILLILKLGTENKKRTREKLEFNHIKSVMKLWEH